MSRTKRSFGPYQAATMMPVVEDFHTKVRQWLATVPIGSPVYVMLTVLNHNVETAANVMRGDEERMRWQNVNAGGTWSNDEAEDKGSSSP